MELDSLLVQVQGALISLKRNNGLKRNPQDENIENTAFYQSIARIRNSFNHSERDMRRIHLYLLLNSNFKFNESLSEDENFSHLVSTTPTVDKYLLVETFLMLEFGKYINETIIFGHSSIGIEYVDVIYTVLKTHRHAHFIPLVESIVSVIHRKLYLLTFCDNRREHEVEQRIFSSYFQQLLALLAPPHDDYKMGYVIKSILSLLCSFLEHNYTFSIPADDDHSLYVMSLPNVQLDVSSTNTVDFNEKEDIRIILSLLKLNLVLVNLTTWMDWFEVEWKSADEDSITRNMQQVVGELAYISKEKLTDLKIYFPELEIIIPALSGMAIKPFDEDEEIKKTDDLEEIIQKVKDESLQPKSRKKWLMALLRIPKSLTVEYYSCFVEELGSHTISVEELLLLLERVGELLSNEPSSRSFNSENFSDEIENIKRTLFKIFSGKVSLKDQGKVIASYFEKFGLSRLFATKDYEKMIREHFNKAVNSSEEPEGPVSESCVLCLQSPSEYFLGLLSMAICNNQITFVMSALNTLSNLCQIRLDGRNCYEDGSRNQNARFLCQLINHFIRRSHWNEVESSNFIKLVIHIQKCAILHQDEIFREILHPSIKESLENKSWNSLDVCLKTIFELIVKSNINPASYQNPAVILAVLLQVLEKGRQEMREKFSSSAASSCELLISYLPQIMEEFAGRKLIEGKSLDWLKAKVMHSFPLSKIYFDCLLDSLAAKDIFKSYQKILIQLFFQNNESGEETLLELLRNEPNILSYSLVKLLPSCTTTEWMNVIYTLKQMVKLGSEDERNLLISNLIFALSNAVVVFIAIVYKKYSYENDESLHIIELYIKNFVRIVKEGFWPCSENFGLEKSCEVFQKIVNLLELIPKEENVQESCGLLVLNILSDIIQSIPCQNLENCQSDPVVLQLVTSISLLSDLESRKCLSRILIERIGKCVCNV